MLCLQCSHPFPRHILLPGSLFLGFSIPHLSFKTALGEVVQPGLPLQYVLSGAYLGKRSYLCYLMKGNASLCVCGERRKGGERERGARTCSLSPPIISERREGAEPRRRDCNAIAAQLKSAFTHTYTHSLTTHTSHTRPQDTRRCRAGCTERSRY